MILENSEQKAKEKETERYNQNVPVNAVGADVSVEVMMAEITIKDIAKICGVGVSTVSRAINNHPDINPATREQIKKVIEEYGYIPNNSARNLKRTESNTIAVLIKGITNTMFSRMIKVFDAKLKRSKFSMIIQQVGYEEDEVAVALELIKEKRLKGIIFLGANYYHREGEMDKISVPFVLSTVGAIADDMDYTLFSHVTVDDMRESYKATEYLIQKGHREIAIISAEALDSSVGRLRLEGYLAALKDYGIEKREELIWRVSDETEHYSMENGYITTQKFLKSGEHFTAIYSTSDAMAVGAYRALREAGLRVPEDISVMGFDGNEICDYVTPKLSTLVQPVEQIAEATIELLQDLIDEQCGNKTLLFEGILLEKESVKDLEVQ